MFEHSTHSILNKILIAVYLQVINTRRTDTPSPGVGDVMRDLPMDTGFVPSDGNLNMDLFSEGATGDMDSLLGNDVDVSMEVYSHQA